MKKYIKLLLVMFSLQILVACGSNEAIFRVVKLNSFDGAVNINRSASDIEVFEGINLEPLDKVTTGDSSFAELCIDTDKHIGVSENTCFEINAVGNENEGKVTISLKYGNALFTIKNKLPKGSEFEVNTPNASLSVRGTTFEVAYDAELEITVVKVTEGVVFATNDSDEISLEAGKAAIITEDEINEVAAEDIADISDVSDIQNVTGNVYIGEMDPEAWLLTAYSATEDIAQYDIKNDGSGDTLTFHNKLQNDYYFQYFPDGRIASPESEIEYLSDGTIRRHGYTASSIDALMSVNNIIPLAGKGTVWTDGNYFEYDEYGLCYYEEYSGSGTTYNISYNEIDSYGNLLSATVMIAEANAEYPDFFCITYDFEYEYDDYGNIISGTRMKGIHDEISSYYETITFTSTYAQAKDIKFVE